MTPAKKPRWRPCPFCSSDKVELSCGALFETWYTFCRKCFCFGPDKDTEAKAIKAWNTRRKPRWTRRQVDRIKTKSVELYRRINTRRKKRGVGR